MTQPKPRIFIGYSLRDRDYVADLVALLSSRGFSTWSQGARDFGKDWRPVVHRELEKCDALLVVRSDQSAYGIWIAREIAWARVLQLPIFVIQIEGAEILPLPGARIEDGREHLMPSEEMLGSLAVGPVRLFNEESESRTPSRSIGVSRVDRTCQIIGVHQAPITEFAVSPGDRSVATVGMDATVKLTSLLDGRILATRPIGEEWLWSVDWHPAARWLAVCGNEGSLRLIEGGAGGAELGPELEFNFDDWLLCARFSPDGSQLAVTGFDGNVTVWRVSEWIVTHRLRGDGDWLYAVAWSPCGQRIGAAGEGGVVFVWAAPWDQPHVELRGHSERLLGLDFSPDGKWLISASGDTTIRVWETESSSTRQIWTGHTGWVLAAKVSPDGRYVLSTSNDGTARLWPIAFDEFDCFEGKYSEVL